MLLESVKKFIKVDGSFEDEVIEDLINAAKAELELSGVPELNPDDKYYPTYELAIKALVAQNYEGRGLKKEGWENIVDTLVLKLKDYSSPAVEDDE